MKDQNYNTTIALAGLIQAITLVREIGQSGRVTEKWFETSIHSIFQTEPLNTEAVFSGVSGVKLGLEKLVGMFNSSAHHSKTLMRYIFSLIHLQRKISRSAKLMELMSKKIIQTKKQVDFFSLTHPTVIGNLSDLYLAIIQPYRFEILVFGSKRTLGPNENLEKIRALLLAAIRAVVLWRQVGGSRLQLLFSRSKIKAEAEKILAEMDDQKVE